MTECGDEDAAFAVVGGPQYRLVYSGAGNRLPSPTVVQRMVVIGSGKNVVRPSRLPSQVGIQFILRNVERLQTPRDGMIGVLDFHGERMPGRMVAVIGSPVASAHLFVLRPAIEGSERQVVHNEALSEA